MVRTSCLNVVAYCFLVVLRLVVVKMVLKFLVFLLLVVR